MRMRITRSLKKRVLFHVLVFVFDTYRYRTEAQTIVICVRGIIQYFSVHRSMCRLAGVANVRAAHSFIYSIGAMQYVNV